MDVNNADTARAWVRAWVADNGRVRPGVLKACRDGQRRAVAIMRGYPGRYVTALPAAQAALDVLMNEVSDDGYPVPVSV